MPVTIDLARKCPVFFSFFVLFLITYHAISPESYKHYFTIISAGHTPQLSSTPRVASATVPSVTPTTVEVIDTDVGSESGSRSGRHPVEAWAIDFVIPWDMLPDGFKKACEQKVRPKKLDILASVRHLGDEIYKVCTQPGSANLAVIARNMVAKYPDSLADTINGELIGDGSTSLHRRLVRHFENRTSNRLNSLRRKLLGGNGTDGDEEIDENDERPSKQKKAANPMLTATKDRYGCVNWQPNDLPEGETEITQEEKRVWLVDEYKKADRDMICVRGYMGITYATQRYVLNNKALLNAIRDQWPFLLTCDGILEHFKVLMGFDVPERCDAFFAKQGATLYKYGKENVSGEGKNLIGLLSSTAKQDKSNIPKTVGAILLLPALLKENVDNVFKMYDVSHETEFDVAL
jgi:hypothetical protein